MNFILRYFMKYKFHRYFPLPYLNFRSSMLFPPSLSLSLILIEIQNDLVLKRQPASNREHVATNRSITNMGQIKI